MTGTVWRVAWRLALRRRRLLAWNVVVPALLLLPVVGSAAAAAHRALVVIVFVAFFGAYGSCIPLIRDGMSGWAEKVLLAGYGERRWLAERLLASTAIDGVQLLPVHLALLLFVDAGAGETAGLLGATALALLFANLLGVLVAAAVRSLAEAALGCAVLSLVALHAAGVFRTPAAGSWWVAVEAWSPFRPLHDAWLALLGGTTGSLPGPGFPVASLAVVTLLAVAFGQLLAGRIAATRPG